MVTVEEAIIAKYDKDGKHFEVLVDPELAYALKDGRTVSLSRMVAVNVIFSDAHKGTRAPSPDIEKAFGTYDIEKIAETIVKKGDVQLTTEFRRKKIEEQRKQIAAFISRNAINPQTRLPHPQDRILNAMEMARVNINPFRPAEQQIDDVVKALKPIIPIAMEEITLKIDIPAQYASRSCGILREFNIQDQQWLSNGALAARVVIPAGLKETLFRKLGSVTEGNVRIEEVK